MLRVPKRLYNLEEIFTNKMPLILIKLGIKAIRTWGTITCEGTTVTPTLDAKVEKGFFYSGDHVWTCYRRNYFSVNVSYQLSPWIPNARLEEGAIC